MIQTIKFAPNPLITDTYGIINHALNPSFEVNVTDDTTFGQGGAGGSINYDITQSYVGIASARLRAGTDYVDAGTTVGVSVPNGASVAGLLSMRCSADPTLGPELVLNGGFETAGAWTHVADLETGDMSQFNGGSGVVSTVAAKHGTYGMVSTMNVESMGRINTPNNTSQVADFWYHPNNFTGAISSLMIMTANVGGWAWLIYQDPTTHQIGSYVFDDTGTVIVAGSPLSVAWHHVRAIWKKSTAPGANDGYAKIYVDGELYTASTGIDNDVKVVDWTDFGMEGAIWGGTGTYWLDDMKVLENAVVPDVFGTWYEYGQCGWQDEQTIVHSGAHALKLVQAASDITRELEAVTLLPSTNYQLTFWTCGDGINAGCYCIYDITHDNYIQYYTDVGMPTGTTYTQVFVPFVTPAGCVSVYIIPAAPTAIGGIAYFDDVSVRELNQQRARLFLWDLTNSALRASAYATALANGAWENLTAAWVNNTGLAATVKLYCRNDFRDSAADVWFDARQLELGVATPYCDGTLPSCYWSGAAHFSTSGRHVYSHSERYHRELERTEFKDEAMEIRDIGGFYSASFKITGFTTEEAIEFLNNGCGRHVEFWDDYGEENWEGMINTVTLQVGAATVRASLADMANRLWCRYQPLAGGSVARSTTLNHLASQARFGIKQEVLNGGQLDLTQADQKAQGYLNQVYWANPELQSITPSSVVPEPVLTINCIGYWQTLDWLTYNQTVLTTTIAASTLVGLIIAALGQYVASAVYDPNPTPITQATDVDRGGCDLLSSICDLGDPNYHLFVAGFGIGRAFYYRQAAADVIERV